MDEGTKSIYKIIGIMIAVMLIIGAIYFGERTPIKPEPQGPAVSIIPTPTLEEYQVPPPKELPPETVLVPKGVERTYIKIIDSCGPYYNLTPCVNVRSGPGTNYPVVMQLRSNIVLPVGGSIIVDGRKWYRITFYDWIRYPERLSPDMYVAADFVAEFNDASETSVPLNTIIPSTKKIVVDRSEEKLYAYDGDVLFMEEYISTGLDDTPTPRGTFHIYRKTPSRYMQGPLPGVSSQYYDLPGVPWDLYFTEAGGAIHGAYWHNNFGQPWSHGCVNLPPDKAEKLYYWADIGMPVIVQD